MRASIVANIVSSVLASGGAGGASSTYSSILYGVTDGTPALSISLYQTNGADVSSIITVLPGVI